MSTSLSESGGDSRLARLYLVAALVGCAAVGAAYWRELVLLERTWRTRDEWGYGYLIVPLAVMILLARIRRFPGTPVRPAPLPGACVVLLGLAIRYATLWVGVESLSWASMVVVLWGVVWGILGTEFLRIAYVPLLYLFLFIPWPADLYERVALPMQRAAAVGSLFILDTLGILAQRDGNVLHLYGGSLEVAQACSGLRLLLAFVSVAAAMAFIVDRPRWQRVVIILSSLPVALLANMTRVVSTAIALEWLGMDAAAGWFHGFAGYAMILMAFGLFSFELWFLGRLVIPEEEEGGDGESPAETAGGLRFLPGRPLAAAAFLAVPLAVIGGIHPRIEQALHHSSVLQPQVVLRRSLREFPERIAGYRLEPAPLEPEIERALKTDEYVRRTILDPTGRMAGTLFISYNGVVRQFYPHRPAVCMPGAGWTQLHRREGRVMLSDGREIPYAAFVFARQGRKMVVLNYFDASGSFVTKVTSLRLHMAKPGAGYVCQVIVGMPIAPGEAADEVIGTAAEILGRITEELESYLPILDDGEGDGA